MSRTEARSWYGRTVLFDGHEVISGSDTCRNPTYSEIEVPADSFLLANYHITTSDLGVEDAGRGQIHVVETRCGGEAWSGFGGLMIKLMSDVAFVPRDGVFFRLRRREVPTTRTSNSRSD